MSREIGEERVASLGQARKPAFIDLERTLPNSYEAEVAALGAFLLNPLEAGSVVRERLAEQHFYYSAHKAIFREMIALQDSLQAIDLVTLTQRLEDKNELDAVGGPAFLADLVTRVPTTAHAESYADIVYEKYLLRQLIEAGTDIIARCFENQDEVKVWLDQVEQRIFKITAERATTGIKPVRELVKDAMGSIERLYGKHGAVTGISTGFRDLDKMTSGLHEGEMVVIAARPSMGKTALAVNIAENVAIDQNVPVGMFSLEMSSEALVTRMLCSRAKVNLRSLRDGFLSERDFHPLTAVASQLMRSPMYLDDTPGLTIGQVRAKARRMKSQFGIRLLVIDYLQLMSAPSQRASLNRQVEIADISSGVKSLAKELKIPIIVLSQLNRQPEQREGGAPRLSDLRESGAIEQDADMVGLLVRAEMYVDDTTEDGKQEKADKEGEANLFIAKQRNGPTGDVKLTFLKEYTRFVDRSKIDEEDVPGSQGSEE